MDDTLELVDRLESVDGNGQYTEPVNPNQSREDVELLLWSYTILDPKGNRPFEAPRRSRFLRDLAGECIKAYLESSHYQDGTDQQWQQFVRNIGGRVYGINTDICRLTPAITKPLKAVFVYLYSV